MSAFDDERLARLLETLEQLAGGDLARVIPISPAHDALDAIAFGINALVDELRFGDQAKTAFVRNISHEIRTPITAILASAQLLDANDPESALRGELVAAIQSNAQALVGLVDEVLDLSKAVAGKLAFDLAPLAPLDVIAEVVRSLQPQIGARPIVVSFAATPDAPRTIDSDARRVRQILTNVIGNALKFTRTGTVHVVLGSIPGDPSRLIIDVSDTGIGLSSEQQNRLFVPFQQADAEISRTYGGTGLGLVLSKRLAEGLGGTLELLSSEPGVGTTFRIVLATYVPGERAAKPAIVRELSPPPPPRALAGLRILLVDDNADIRMPIGELLTLVGARVVEASNGNEAIIQVTNGKFDLVLMDVRMPELDGLAATRTLRARGCVIPIVALTADAMREHHAECLAAGYDDYIAKPIDFVLLVQLVLRATRTVVRATPR